MTAQHSGDLDHALMAALHTATPHASAVDIRVAARGRDGTPTLYRVTAYRGVRQFQGQGGTPLAALNAAMENLTAALVGSA
jgi:hypothetical protein